MALIRYDDTDVLLAALAKMTAETAQAQADLAQARADAAMAKANAVTATANAAADKADTAALAAAAIPQPATSAPPGVGVSGAAGTSTAKFALADHTHATSVQRAKLKVATAGAPIRWTFPKPYPDGVVPVCTATAEIPSTSNPAAALPFLACVYGTPTNAYVDYIVFRTMSVTLGSTLLAIAGTVVNVFGPAPVDAVIDVQAALPTQ